MDAVADILRASRKGKGYTVRQLGNIAKVHFTTISDFEGYRRDPSPESLAKICYALGVLVNERAARVGTIPISSAGKYGVLLYAITGLNAGHGKWVFLYTGSPGMFSYFRGSPAIISEVFDRITTKNTDTIHAICIPDGDSYYWDI